MKHKDTKVFLHSHEEKYPLRYDDGRVSSQGQQVTGYHHADPNNEWQIIPTHDIPDHGRGRVVRHRDIVQLLHVRTNSYLLTHDVASPLMPTNQEFTTWPKGEDMSRYNDTLFQFDISDAHDGEALNSKSGHFKLVHVPTRVALWTYTSRLPDWAFNQQEVNGNKNLLDKSNIWFVDDVVADGRIISRSAGHDFKNRTAHVADKPVRHVNFFKKFFELQVLMLQHNAGLTSSHPYASEPFGWPFLLSGISFWTDNETSQQIYLMGNVAGWWICVAGMSVWCGIMLADALSRRRGIHPIEDSIRNRMLRNTGFFMIGWACHYFPFFLMNRQRFLHHYLPAHLISALVAGTVLNFVTTEIVNYPISKAGLTTRLRPRVRAKMDITAKIVTAVLIAIVVAMWYFLSPLTYGSPGLTGEEVNRRKLLGTWSLHFEGLAVRFSLRADTNLLQPSYRSQTIMFSKSKIATATGFVVLSLAWGSTAQVTASGTMGPTNPPAATRGTAINQTSDSRLLSLNSIDDFCLFAPPEPGATIGDTEADVVAFCTINRNNARVIPDGVLKAVHFVKTPLYVQVQGWGDFSKLGVAAGDQGGELDPHGATGEGNPVGGNVTSNVTGSDVPYQEWMSFMSATQFCLRICISENTTYSAALECQHTLDLMGCEWVMPGDYTENSFTSCDGDAAYPPGIYPQSDGSTSTFAQRYSYTDAAGATQYGGDTVTPVAPYSTPATSNCQTFTSVGNGIASLALAPTAPSPIISQAHEAPQPTQGKGTCKRSTR
ncbi:hypothetical protein QFC22_003872 [Naganishia vaughanmartiniae]|uniref:Uncharacterized protein n=1 Tax=Naganishia vaughanmartiniae TaxID=1424756 RepID=A0ACC2X7B8_9TREE|nr:hypothetical protein QFC22_003872 [Naganishia vaughanmartiniae]